MPLKGELGGSSGELRGPTGNGYLGSISSLAGSGLKTLAGIQAPYVGNFLLVPFICLRFTFHYFTEIGEEIYLF